MSGGLTLSLKPREKFLVGGCLLENGPKKSSIKIVDDSVFVLRLSDALHPDEVTTPVTRAYHLAQLILACEVAEDEGQPDLLQRLNQLGSVFCRTPEAETIRAAITGALGRRYHAVLTNLKQLRALETEMLSMAMGAQPVPEQGVTKAAGAAR